MEVDSVKPSSSVPQRNWEKENNVQNVDSIFEYNNQQQMEIRNAKPWDKDPNYFTNIKISAIALLKMTMHAKRGGNLEIMGLLQGRIDANSFIILDVFALPVEGTETRVNAQAQAYEYMTVYSEMCEAEGRQEKVVGWYHSHPGYGCWLSGIDVSTQTLNQKFQEPWVAIVIDPLRTMSAGKVDIGAFRTYPESFRPPDDAPSEYQSIPLAKIEDFGVHCKRYYSLDVSFFKSQLDAHILTALWNSYWISTLSSSPLFSNVEFINNQITDINQKLLAVDKKLLLNERSNDAQEALTKVVTDAKAVGDELETGRISHIVKQMLFARQAGGCGCRHNVSESAMDVAVVVDGEKENATSSEAAPEPAVEMSDA
ncbi:hypothetical protein CAEBREN_15614 [Caenorhabditis brenneri]|uniref:MPN domain-containing protein n=1 Tax=Caenorhabditis brenneri TaxID=135651 RepID=G0NA84_CAEBE|nr:hypothetical protein CAEBREN_15614 [Caenorhabditis brenneri]